MFRGSVEFMKYQATGGRALEGSSEQARAESVEILVREDYQKATKDGENIRAG